MKHTHIDSHTDFNWRFGIAIVINLIFVGTELVFGFLSDSLALLADAGHNAFDILGLALGLGANLLRRREPNEEHTYGWRNATILAALLNSLILMFVVATIVREAVARFGQVEGINSTTVIWVAAVATVINLATALIFRRGREQDLNVQGAYLHMTADAGVSVGVVISGFLLKFTGWMWIDPVISIVIAGIIFWSTFDLLRDSFHLAFGGVPRELELTRVKEYLAKLPEVDEVHDLHVWGLSTTETALTAHLVLSKAVDQDALIEKTARGLAERFDIDHSTLQIEYRKSQRCEEQLI